MQAILQIRELRREQSLSVEKDWLQTVRAIKILKYGTPRSTVQLFAGDHQHAQGGVVNVTASQFLKLACAEPETTLKDIVVSTIQKCGWERDTPV